MEKYDLIVIGSGPAGHVAAIKAAQNGARVAVIEKDKSMFGGVCLNEGCIPAKSLYHNAKIIDIVRSYNKNHSKTDEVPCDMTELVTKARKASEQIKKGLEFIFKKNNIDLLLGIARFVGDNEIELENGEDQTILSAETFLVATGSSPKPLKGLEFDGEKVLCSSDAIRLDSVPKRLLIVGGGVIGCEFASFFNLLGSEVTLLELTETLLPGWDKDVSGETERLFIKKGIQVLVSGKVKEVNKGKDQTEVTIITKDGNVTKEYDTIIVCAGRMPNTVALKLEKVKVAVSENGFIAVDSHMRTNVGNVFAAGDVVNTPMLAHTASCEGEIVAKVFKGEEPFPIDYSSIPIVVYTDIEAASVGFTEEKLKDKGVEYLVGKHQFRSNGRAVASDQKEGFVKVIADKHTKRLVGAHIVGENASEMIHEFAVARVNGLTVDQIADAVHAHPTLSETIMEAARAVFGKPMYG